MPDIRFAKIATDPRFRRPRKKKEVVVPDNRFRSIFVHNEQSKQSDNHVHKDQNLFQKSKPDQDVQSLSLPDYARGEILLESSDEEDESEGPSLRMNDSISTDVKQLPHDLSVDVDLDEDNLIAAQAIAFSTANSESIEPEVVPTKRLAAVNLDWDRIRATHLFKICSSFLPSATPMASSSSGPNRKSRDGVPSRTSAKGKILSVKIYPSEFGKERMAREEIEGPPSEIFGKKGKNGEVTIENLYDVGDQDEYDNDALRNYQLERLRYFYAIITCDTVDAAAQIYHELEGTELERSANIFDLSYVPDDMIFDENFRDQAAADTFTDHKGVDFVTDALRHSTVKLTWEEDDPERHRFTRRTLTKEEIENGDFRAYLASSESESEREAESTRDKGVSRDKLRKLLGGANDLPEGWNRDSNSQHDAGLQITFTPGLSEKKDETTLDKYQRKMKDKRKQRRAEIRGKALQTPRNETDDDFFDVEDGSNSKQTERPPSTAEELALLVTSDNPDTQPAHFNLKSILNAEKKAYQRRNDGDEDESQSQFVIDVNDERFKALHEDHQFAIDPSNPRFKKTKAMDAFLKERSRRQKKISDLGYSTVASTNGEIKEEDLTRLIKSVKRKGSNGVNKVDKRYKSN